LIWHRGEIVPDDALRVSVLDRTFEHGLGLFETLRTWNGEPTLLSLHVERMQRSARELGLTVDPAQLPDAKAVYHLIEASRTSLPVGQDVRIRLTLSGGCVTTSASGSTLWMTAGPLPPNREAGGIITQTCEVTADDCLARHKTLNYWRKRIAQTNAAANGSDDVLCLTPDQLVCETCRANVFLIEKRRLYTPDLGGPLLPGIMRAVVLARARHIGLEAVECPLPIDRIRTTDEAFLTSSLRGMLPIARLLDRELPSPGAVTRQLWSDVSCWLEARGKSS
jgi:branched-subunit amino acid aminotransferase/4-amino-4-deoxychorismate lyase